jgi:hypothetical protein
LKTFYNALLLPTCKSKDQTQVRLINKGQRVTSWTVCEAIFELARHEFRRIFPFSFFGTTQALPSWTEWQRRLQSNSVVFSASQCHIPRFTTSCVRRAKARDVMLISSRLTTRRWYNNRPGSTHERHLMQNNVRRSGRYSTMTSGVVATYKLATCKPAVGSYH